MASAGSVLLSSAQTSPSNRTAAWLDWTEQGLAAGGLLGSVAAVVAPREDPGVGEVVAEEHNLVEPHTAVTESSV